MTISRASRSDPVSPFEQLHPAVQRWVWNQGWGSLRPVQDAAIPVVMAGQSDVLITAPTAGGKTEAAFLPILSTLIGREDGGLAVLCVSPLRALITDQARRLESLCEATELTVQAWHSDVSKGKAAFWKRPTDVLLITPESLESFLMRRADAFARIAMDLRYVVIDELHAFFEGPRGAQLRSLLNRLEHLIGRSPPRIALSATVGDIDQAARFLRPDGSRPCEIIEVRTQGGELRVGMLTVAASEVPSPISANVQPTQVTALPHPNLPMLFTEYDSAEDEQTWVSQGMSLIADHLFERLRGRSNLVFANARARVELLTDALVERAEQNTLPNEFFCHHGSLSREHRSEVEDRLRAGTLPTTVVCTSTLELGIDIGDVSTVAQIGPAPSVASLKQRVGRSGRREQKVQVLRQYIELRQLRPDADLLDHLTLPLIQAIATIEGLREGDYEPPVEGDLHLSTLIQQILSRIAQGNRGEHAASLFKELCGPGGPFSGVDAPLFADVLRSLGREQVIEQIDGGALLPGARGESMLNDYTFVAAFNTPEEFRIIGPQGRPLGTMPIDDPISPGQLLVFAGRRWRVTALDPAARTLTVEPGPKGRPPNYPPGGPSVPAGVHRRMRALLASSDLPPPYVDTLGATTLAHAQGAFHNACLNQQPLVELANSTLWFHWAGTRGGATLALLLVQCGVAVLQDGPALRLHGVRQTAAIDHIREIAGAWPATPDELAAIAPALCTDRHDELLSERARARGYASRMIDLANARAAVDAALA